MLIEMNINHNILFCFVDMLPDIDKKPEKQVIIKMAGYLEKKGRMVSNMHVSYTSRYHRHIHYNIVVVQICHNKSIKSSSVLHHIYYDPFE